MKIQPEARRVLSLLWLLVAIAIVSGAIVAGLMGWTLWDLSSQRVDLLEKKQLFVRQSQKIRGLTIDARLGINELLNEEKSVSPGFKSDVNEELQKTSRKIRENSETGAERDITVQLEDAVTELSSFWQRTSAWRSRYEIVLEDILQKKSLGIVRSRLSDMRTAVESVEGKHDLEQAIKIFSYRRSEGKASDRLAHNIVQQQIKRTHTGVDTIKTELVDISRLSEVLASELSIDLLVDLRDNQLKPSLERLQRNIAELSDKKTGASLELEAMEGLMVSLFGVDYMLDKAHQTVRIGSGGLYAMRHERLNLGNAHLTMHEEAETIFKEIDGIQINYNQFMQRTFMALNDRAEQRLSNNWQQTLYLLGSTVMIFLALAVLITRTVHKQVGTLADLRRQNDLILSAVGEGIIGVNMQGQITFVNPATTQILGWDAAELVGHSQHELIHHTKADDSPYHAEDCRICTYLSDGIAHNGDDEFFRLRDGSSIPVSYISSPIRDETGQLEGAVLTFKDISERKQAEKELKDSEQRFRQVSENSAEWIWEIDAEGRYTYSNSVVVDMLGYQPEEINGRYFWELFELEQQTSIETQAREMFAQKKSFHHFTNTLVNKEGHLIDVETSGSPFFDDDGKLLGYRGVDVDVTDLKASQSQLLQQEKMVSIGQLAAGVAHEINTPIQFVSDNTHFLQEAFADYNRLFAAYDRLTEVAVGGAVPDELVTEIQELKQEVDIDYLKEEVPQAVRQSMEGLTRIANIVRAMKEFSHPGTDEKTPTDLKRAIKTTIDISRNEWKYCAELITELDPDLPQVPVLPGEFNQVILNMIINAAHAIFDVVGTTGKKGEIRITSQHDGEWAKICISDTGKGIPQEIQKRIFDPFYTTKEVGKGTGQGLAISWSVIVDKHGGTIDVESEENKGTSFTIRLPITQDTD